MANPMQPTNILVIHGPNLNMLGKREPELYGKLTLAEIDRDLVRTGRALNLRVDTFQSNSEGALVDRLQQARGQYRGIVINAAAYTHTSVAIRDALLLLDMPIVELHLSNIYKREPFRHKSLIADVCTGQISGLGPHGYILALRALAEIVLQT